MMDAGVVWDNHGCIPLRETEGWLPGIARYRAAGVDAVTLNIGDSRVPLETLVRTAASIRHFVQQHPDLYLLGLTTADIRAARGSGRLAVCLDVEGVHALGEQVSLVEFLYQVGVRWMLMAYNRRKVLFAHRLPHGTRDPRLDRPAGDLLSLQPEAAARSPAQHPR